MTTRKNPKTLYVVSGNVNGSELEPLLRKRAARADVAIAGTVLGVLGKMGYVKEDGRFKDCIVVEMTVASRKGSCRHAPYRVIDFAEIIDRGKPDEHVTTVTLRNRRSRHAFAEWVVTKVKA